ncbi:MAG: SBBP repeat-containing protein, partial [Flavobacteriales bacterium]|nr:SBBP repeat-containing protein [Flavobacteriales bacterium]
MKKTILLFAFVLLKLHLFAQQSEQAFLEAYAEKGAQEFFYKNSRASYGGYTYVAGASINDDGNHDMLLVKYSGTTEVWSQSWNGSANGDDYAADVVIDGSGNIIICGATQVTSINYNAVVAKYNSSGTLQWASSYAGSANLADGFVSIEKDNSNNYYVCGGTLTTTEQSNFVTVKYNSSGTQQWASTYDYSDLQDVAVKITVSSGVEVSRGSQANSTDWKMTTVRYNLSTGAQVSVNQTGGDDEGVDKVTDAWTDGTYTSTGYDWKVLKLDANLTVTWSATYNGNANQDDEAQSVKVDASSNVYVTGWATVTGQGRNFVTRKYNSSGTVQWTSSFIEPSSTGSGQGEMDDEAQTLELDASGHVLISGSSYKDGNTDYLTIKYKYSDGLELWRTRFNSDYNDNDIPSNIALDESGNIYVIGTVGKGNGTTTYMMCKYSVKTVYMPVPTDSFSSSGGYVTNKGQIRNSNGASNTSIKFYNKEHYPSTYIDDTNFSMVFAHCSEDSVASDTLHRIDMKFNKGVTNAKVYNLKQRDEYIN